MFIFKVGGLKIGALYLPTRNEDDDDDDERLGRVISLLISFCFALVWFRLGCLCKMQIGVICIFFSTHGLI